MYFDPLSDVFETDKALVIMIDLPGVDANKLKVAHDDDSKIVVQGERKLPKIFKVSKFHRQDIPKGDFAISYDLDPGYDLDKMTVEFGDGVLYVKVPKKKVTKPRKKAQQDV
jgi:HSP20 family protein